MLNSKDRSLPLMIEDVRGMLLHNKVGRRLRPKSIQRGHNSVELRCHCKLIGMFNTPGE